MWPCLILLAQRLLVPELLQDAATPDAMAQLLSPLLDNGDRQTDGFDAIHRTLRCDASSQAADAVLELIGAVSYTHLTLPTKRIV